MKNSIKLILIPLLLFSVLSCDTDEDCEDKLLDITSLESEYGCVNTTSQLQIDLIDDYLIIRNQSEFETLVSGDCQPEIDFGIYDLIIGTKGLTNGLSSVEYELIENCESGDLELEVTINLNATLIAPLITYHALIPKLGDEQLILVFL